MLSTYCYLGIFDFFVFHLFLLPIFNFTSADNQYITSTQQIIKKKEATDAYANWIYITIAHSAPSPRTEKAHHGLCIYTRWVDAHRCLHLSTYLKFPTFQQVRIRR